MRTSWMDGISTAAVPRNKDEARELAHQVYKDIGEIEKKYGVIIMAGSCGVVVETPYLMRNGSINYLTVT